MKKNGFTLIELLAVIVILAIIALIATPIVLNIIEDTKNSATLRSADFYLDAVELSIAKSVLNGGDVDGEYTINSSGNICKEENGEDVCLEVEVGGQKPTSGKITIEDGNIKSIYKLTLGGKTVSTDNNGNLSIMVFDNYTITYKYIDGSRELPSFVEEGETVEINLTGVNIELQDLIIKIDNREISEFTYTNNILTIPNVSGNIIIEDATPAVVQYIKNMYNEGIKKTSLSVNNINYNMVEVNNNWGLINDRLGSRNVDANAGNIRYYGVNPNNYIDIGDRGSTDEDIIFWRIIGVFKNITVVYDNTTSTEDLVKIIRVDNLSDGTTSAFSWDFKYDGTNGTWSDRWGNATITNLLNSENCYYGSGGQCTHCNADVSPTTINFSNIGLSNDVKSKVAQVQWDINGSVAEYVDDIYREERTGGNSWNGQIALMYPSDYGYAADLSKCINALLYYNSNECKNTNWLFNSSDVWTITAANPNIDIASGAIYIQSDGSIFAIDALDTKSVRPVLYLKSDVSIKETKTATINGVETSYYVVE